MWTQDGALLLLLACCLWSAGAQSEGRQSSLPDSIPFKTRDEDWCTMMITDHGEYTRLNVSCQSNERSYWCEYMGKPHTCKLYNINPGDYFFKVMWVFRLLPNACQGPKQIKPYMCMEETDESQMVFTSASFSHSKPEALSRKPAAKSAQFLLHPQDPKPQDKAVESHNDQRPHQE